MTPQTGHETTQSLKELANFLTLFIDKTHGTILSALLERWENFVFSMVAAALLITATFLASRKKTLAPGPFQNAVEFAAESLESVVINIIGPRGRKYVPFLGTLFFYILVQNLMGVIPGLKSPTSNLNTTVSLALCVFFYVQWIGIKENGLLGYLFHLMGNPKSVIDWALVPLNFPLHVMGELIRPVSLSLRLFGNIMGDDAVISVFVGLGILVAAVIHSPVGIPFQLPIMLLAILTGTIQALVFTLLSTIYISLALPHEDRE